MRRVWASLLTGLFVFLTMAPLFFDDANLAACCRRNGKHHCAMMSMHQTAPNVTPSGTPSLLTARCPKFPASSVASSASKLWLPAASQAFFAAVVSHPAVHPQITARQRVAFLRSSQKRGPPSFLA